MRRLIYASRMSFGGNVLLEGYIKRLRPMDTILFVDEGFNCSDSNLQIKRYKSSIITRPIAEFNFRKSASEADEIIFFSGSPLFFFPKYSFQVVLQDRLLFELSNLKRFGYDGLRALKIYTKRFFLWLLLIRRNDVKLVVQTQLMWQIVSTVLKRKVTLDNDLGIKFGHDPDKVVLRPSTDPSRPIFVCISSIAPHKNLGRLLDAWNQAYKMLPKDAKLVLILEGKVFDIKNIPSVDTYWNISRSSVSKILLGTAYIVQPSLCESLSLPLIEAKNRGLKIIAADLDYVYEICCPCTTFDPMDPADISVALLEAFHGEQ